VRSVFIYEYITGGGTFSSRDFHVPSGSLLREGAAMVRALAGDFLRLRSVEVFLLRDARLSDLPLPDCNIREIHEAEDEQQAIRELAAKADWTVLIAPEFDGQLLERCFWAEAADGRLLSPPFGFVRYATDKNCTEERLRNSGVPMPFAVRLEAGQPLPANFPYPAVLKPPDGAGSVGVRLITGRTSEFDTAESTARLEMLCHGTPASIAVLCGPGGNVALPACRQRMSSDGRFRYLGGETPLEAPLSRRAKTLGLAAIASLPPAVGYVGVDLILGDALDGADDVVLEINPRLTTSYVGLRCLARTNLAEAMIAVAEDRTVEWSFSDRRVEFEANGRVEMK